MPPWAPFPNDILTALLHACFAPAQQNYGCFCSGHSGPSGRAGKNGAFQQQNQLHWKTARIPPPPPPLLFPLAVGSNAPPDQGSKALEGGRSVLAHAWPQRTRGALLCCSHTDAARDKAACPAARRSSSRGWGPTLFAILHVVVEGRLQIP